jgi:hypothetical protein
VVPGWWEQRGSELFKTISRVFSLSLSNRRSDHVGGKGDHDHAARPSRLLMLCFGLPTRGTSSTLSIEDRWRANQELVRPEASGPAREIFGLSGEGGSGDVYERAGLALFLARTHSIPHITHPSVYVHPSIYPCTATCHPAGPAYIAPRLV